MFTSCNYKTKIELVQHHDNYKSSTCVFACNTTSIHFKSQYCFLFFFFTFCIMSLVASELTADTLCLCFKFRYFIKQIPTFYCLNSFNVISVISTGYVINLLLLLPQFIMDTEKVTLDQRKSTFITYRAATGMSIVYWLKMCLKFLKLYVS